MSAPALTLLLRLFAAACLAASAACAVEDVIVARDEVPEGGAGSGCSSMAECGPREYCEKTSCTDTQGQCQPRPATCDSQPYDPVCGCDGVNYWNDCVRQQAGTAGSGRGQCMAQTKPCGGIQGSTCPTAGASCARLIDPGARDCPPQDQGECWLVPECPVDAGPGPTPMLWESCGAGPPMCTDLCNAIRSERPFRPSMPGPWCWAQIAAPSSVQ
jgi:hypothetical protein